VIRATSSVICACLFLVLLSGADAVNLRHMSRARATPVAKTVEFKEEAQTEAQNEAEMKVNQERSQQQLDNQVMLLNMQEEEISLLLQLKTLEEAREQAESTLLHKRLLEAQCETAHLVSDLSTHTKNKMLFDLAKLNSIMSHAMVPRVSSAAINTKLTQQPAASASVSSAAESPAVQAMHRQLVGKAEEVVDAELDGILNSDELAYIKAHNDQMGSDSSNNGDIVEQDTGALPGETADQHYNRLMKEADQLMAEAYPSIKCEGANGVNGGTGLQSSTGSTGSTGETGSSTGGNTGGSTTATGTAGSATTGTAATAATGTGGGATGTASGTGVFTGSSSSSTA